MWVTRVRRLWRGVGRALITGAASVACVAMTTVPAQLAAASQGRPPRLDTTGAPGATGAHICRAWFHDGQTRTALANKLSADIEAALHGRAGTYAVRMQDPHLGVGCGLHAGEHFYSASVAKATILAALMRKVQAQHRNLTANEKSLASRMITQSDNAAATELWNDTGRRRLQRFLDLAGMSQTVLGPSGYWGLTRITAHDETLLLWVLLKPNSVLTKAHRLYELGLMAHVIPSQRFGVPAGAPAGFTVHVKNGWLPLPSAADPWYVNSIGGFTAGADKYSIVVLTHGTTAQPSMAYGITTIENVAVKIHHDLNPELTAAVSRSTPSPSWAVPDEPIPPAVSV